MKKVIRWTLIIFVLLCTWCVAMIGLSLGSRWDNEAKTVQTSMHLKNLRLGEPENIRLAQRIKIEDFEKTLSKTTATWAHWRDGVNIYLENPDGLLWLDEGAFDSLTPNGFSPMSIKAKGDNLIVTWYEPMSGDRVLALMGIGAVAILLGLSAIALMEYEDSSEPVSNPGTA